MVTQCNYPAGPYDGLRLRLSQTNVARHQDIAILGEEIGCVKQSNLGKMGTELLDRATVL